MPTPTPRRTSSLRRERTELQASLAMWAASLASRQRAIDEEVAYMGLYDEDAGQDSDG